MNDGNTQVRTAQALEQLAKLDVEGNYGATKVMNGLQGKTISYLDNPKVFDLVADQLRTPEEVASGLKSNADSGGGGATFHYTSTSPLIYISPNAAQERAYTGLDDLSAIVGVAIHETIHSAGFDHGLALSDGNDGVVRRQDKSIVYSDGASGSQSSEWNSVIKSIKDALPPSTLIYDPVRNSNQPLNSSQWAFNEDLSCAADGTPCFNTLVSSAALQSGEDKDNIYTVQDGLRQLAAASDSTVTASSIQLADFYDVNAAGARASESLSRIGSSTCQPS